MKKIKYVVVAFVATIFLGCEDSSSFAITENIPVPDCSTPSSEWLKVNSGDTVKSVADDTEIIFDHDQDENKAVCTKSGIAVVDRAQ